jgi:LuxR family maltose regulon positive regulatory protein
MHLHRIIIRFWQNRLDDALAEARLVSRLQRLFFPADHRLQWLCRVFASWVLFELGEVEEAAALLQDPLDGLGASEGWFEAQLLAHVTSANIAAADGQVEEATAVLTRGKRLAAARDLPRLRWHLDFQRVMLSLRGGTAPELPRELHFHADALDDPAYFTWRERFQAGVLDVRIAIRNAAFERAAAVLDELNAQLEQIEVPRARTTLLLLRAHLARAQGNAAAHARFVDEATGSFQGSCSVQLFADADIEPPSRRVQPPVPVSGIAADGSGTEALTQREREIIGLLASGRPNKAIAHEIGLSEATVKFHLRNIYRKLKAHNRVQAIAHHQAGR